MKTLRHFLSVIVLTLMLVTAAHAGDMHTTITTPPGGASVTTEGDITTGVNGEITTGNADAAVAGGSLTDAAAALIQSVLSLF